MVSNLSSQKIEIQVFKKDSKDFWRMSTDKLTFSLDQGTKYFVNYSNDPTNYLPISHNDIVVIDKSEFVYIYSDRTDAQTKLPIADLVVVTRTKK